MNLRTIFAVSAALFLSSPAIAQETLQVPVDDTFVEDGISVQGEGKSYLFRWDAFRVDGRIAICGAGKFVDANSAVAMRRLMRKAVVELDGKKILTDLAFFTKVRKNDDLVGATATCKVTSTKAQSKAGAIYIVLPSGHIRF